MRYRIGVSRAADFAAVLIFVATQAGFTIAQTANGNAGLAGGQDSLFDAILATPNRKTPVPQDNIFATAPGAGQATPTPQSKVIAAPPVRKHISPGEHQ